MKYTLCKFLEILDICPDFCDLQLNKTIQMIIKQGGNFCHKAGFRTQRRSLEWCREGFGRGCNS